MTLICEYKSFNFHLADYKHFYDCTVRRQEIPEGQELIFIGEHENGKSNKDVTSLEILFCQVTRFPQGLMKIFPKLKALNLNSSKLQKITKEDLAEYRHLEYLWIDGNQIDFLPGDLLVGFENLVLFSFELNKGRIVEPDILNGQKKLKFASLRKHAYSLEKFYSKIAAWLGEATLDEVKLELYDRYYKYMKSLDNGSSSKLEKLASPKQPTENVDMVKSTECQKIRKKTANDDANDIINNEQLKQESTSGEGSLIHGKNRGKRRKQFKKLRNSKVILEDKIQSLEQENSSLKKKLASLEDVEQKSTAVEQMDNNLNSDIKKLLQDENFKDFKIKIQDKEFLVHKFIFAARSPVIAKMLHKNPEAENLELFDISVEIFEKVLDFVYNDKVPVENFNKLIHLFAAAGRLNIENLKNFAALKVTSQICHENVVEIFNFGCKYQHEEMKKKSFEEIKKIYSKIDFKDDWADQPERVVKLIEAFKRKEEAMLEFEKILEEN